MTTQQETAAHLFNVLEEQVTNSMIAKLHTTISPLEHPEDLGWVDCTDCKQSATAKYLGIFGCSRCGWSAGGARNRRNIL